MSSICYFIVFILAVFSKASITEARDMSFIRVRSNLGHRSNTFFFEHTPAFLSNYNLPVFEGRIQRKRDSFNIRNLHIISHPIEDSFYRKKILQRIVISPRFSSHNADDKEVNLNPSFDFILNNLNPSQIEAVTQPVESMTRVIAGPGAGKTRVLTCRIAYLLKQTKQNDLNPKAHKILAVTFTKKASMEMKHRLEALLSQDQSLTNNFVQDENQYDPDDDNIYESNVYNENDQNSRPSTPALMDRVTLGTFHSICAKILRWNGSELSSLPTIKNLYVNDPIFTNSTSAPLDGSFAIIDQSDQLRILKQCLSDCGIDLKGNDDGGIGSKKVDVRPITVLNAIGKLKSQDALFITHSDQFSSQNIKEQEMKISSKVKKIADEVYPLYRKALINQNALDFDDLILLTRELLAININVRDKMRQRWQHILVDEFQDTSQVQLDLVKLLTTNSVFIVGDGDQSIYSWRGAFAESMSHFVDQFSRNKTKDDKSTMKQDSVNTVYLMENYRSTTNIVKAAQKVISSSSSTSEKSSSNQSSIRQDMVPMRGKGPSPRVLACANGKAEATFVVKEILKMIDDGTLNPSSSVAIIYRTNSQSRSLEEACVAHNLKYLVRGNVGTFYSRIEIKDCLCFLKWLNNGRDRSSMLRALTTPSRGIGDTSINEFLSYCEEVEKYALKINPLSDRPTPLDVLLSLSDDTSPENEKYRHDVLPQTFMSKRTLNRLIPFSNQMRTIYGKAQIETLPNLLNTIMETLKLKDHFDSISKTSEEFADRLANVNELINAADRYSSDGPCLTKKDDGSEQNMFEGESSLGRFLDDVSLLTETENDNSEPDGSSENNKLTTNLMTIHASKGMEFDAVFIVGNEEGTFPTQKAITEGETSIELEEERRLCYVAMTRAKTHLVMTWRREVMLFFGQGFKVDNAERSRFLDVLVTKKVKDVQKQPPGNSNRRDALQQGETRSRYKYTDPKEAYTRRPVDKISSQQIWRKEDIRMIPSKSFDRKISSVVPRTSINSASLSKGIRPKGSSMKRLIPKLENRGIGSGIQRQKKTIQSRESIPDVLDSTLFYPVGKSVKHEVHGEGVIIPTIKGFDCVSVRFDTGMELQFPIDNSGLTIKY